ncbi:hypothetical protein [Mycetocola sp. JXN-3]|uniref:hypothetical protein n=1 Tax=Mycetocola sp. JXN-3 TaxID=2116510 RepID=UPI00165D12CC|nr:hypothetical protein [Mycetocola sp. JXN-3]
MMKRQVIFSTLLALVIVLGSPTTVGALGVPTQPSEETISAEAPTYPDELSGLTQDVRSQEDADQRGGDLAVMDYWTDERLASAIPIKTPEVADDLFGDARSLSPVDELNDEDIVAEPLDVENGAETMAAPVTNFSRTSGKVFFRNASN